jgi:hypothetical protein
MLLCLIATTAPVVGCQRGDDEGRRRFAEQGFSLIEPAGWSEQAERGAVVFVGPSELGQERNTIAARSAALEARAGERGIDARVTSATRTVLDALPGARVVAATPFARDGLRGTRFDLSFTPRERPGQRYQRTHLVLVGRSRILHLVHTAPEGRLQDTEEVFDQVAASLAEEV